jgi:cell division protein FtsI (penicillin-binding protein 3)
MATRTTQQPKQTIMINRWRLNAVLIVMLLLVARITAQLADIQLLRHGELSARARREIDRPLNIEQSRGVIRDRKGNVLALDVQMRTLYVEPHLLNPEYIDRLTLVLSGMVGKPAPEIEAVMRDTELQWATVARWLQPEIADRIGELMEQDPEMWAGLQFGYEPKRIYPQGYFAAQVLGAVNDNRDGISGVEATYNTILRGSTGVITAELDAAQQPIWIAPQETQPATDGADLELTIDPLVQHTIEYELQKAVEAHNADSGTIIVLDVKTGAIRGMASWPSFDPNRYGDFPQERYYNNPAVSDMYEPGSTFKIATAAIGLDAKTFTPETTVEDPGTIFRYGWSLSNWNSGANGTLTPARMLYYSSNVAAIQFNELTGPDIFYKKVGELGYGQLTGVDLYNEAPGIVRDPAAEDFSPLTFNTNSYGQGIAVTPLQQVRMVATIGNDGIMMKPYVVQRQCHGSNCVDTQPEVIGRPIAPEVARAVRLMLVDSANHYAPVVWGERTGIYEDTWLVPGYKVAAKTGTSTVPDGKGGFEDWTIGSVTGLVPAEQPRYAILVKIDHPKDDIWGVSTAVPVYQAIAARLVTYERIAPDPDLYGPGQKAEEAGASGEP